MIETTSPVVILSRGELDAAIDAAARKAVSEMLARVPMNQPRPPHVNQAQAAEMLDLSPPTVKKLINSGKLRLNDAGLIPMADIDRLIDPPACAA